MGSDGDASGIYAVSAAQQLGKPSGSPELPAPAHLEPQVPVRASALAASAQASRLSKPTCDYCGCHDCLWLKQCTPVAKSS